MDINALEEGFCHFIGAAFSNIGVMIDTNQSRYIANFLLEKGCPPYIALGQVHSYRTLYEFMKKHGVLDLENPETGERELKKNNSN